MVELNTLVILIPVYNDWESVALLLPTIDDAVATAAAHVQVLLVDDGSSQPAPATMDAGPHLEHVNVLVLRRNLGHQRAIAVGLCHIHSHIPCDAVLIMDGDGEDGPGDIPRLVERFRDSGGRTVVFAERTRRSESLVFRAFYQAYRLAHWILTGISVKVGNFSLLPRSALGQLVVVSDLWNHYAAAVFKARLPRSAIKTQRAHRLRGASHMNFVSLVVHGLSAVSVFADLAGVRLLISFVLLMVTTLGGLAAFLSYRLVAGIGISTGVVIGSAVLVVMLLQVGLSALVACFITLGARNIAAFIPQRDYVHFVDRLVPLPRPS